jgi:hypothetical protein
MKPNPKRGVVCSVWLGGVIQILKTGPVQRMGCLIDLMVRRWRRIVMRIYRPLHTPLAGIPLLFLDVVVYESARFRPFRPASTLRRRLAWKWVGLMARIGLMDEPVQIVLRVRGSDSTVPETPQRERVDLSVRDSGLSYCVSSGKTPNVES